MIYELYTLSIGFVVEAVVVAVVAFGDQVDMAANSSGLAVVPAIGIS